MYLLPIVWMLEVGEVEQLAHLLLHLRVAARLQHSHVMVHCFFTSFTAVSLFLHKIDILLVEATCKWNPTHYIFAISKLCPTPAWKLKFLREIGTRCLEKSNHLHECKRYHIEKIQPGSEYSPERVCKHLYYWYVYPLAFCNTAVRTFIWVINWQRTKENNKPPAAPL